jgi:hypothetical protein
MMHKFLVHSTFQTGAKNYGLQSFTAKTEVDITKNKFSYISYIFCLISSSVAAHRWKHLLTSASHEVVSNPQTKRTSFFFLTEVNPFATHNGNKM